jgi:hypothetical protein
MQSISLDVKYFAVAAFAFAVFCEQKHILLLKRIRYFNFMHVNTPKVTNGGP